MISKFRFPKVAVFLLCFAPTAWLIFAALTDRLSANPIKDITEETGAWTLRLLLLTLSVTPLRKLTGWNELIRYRRMLGLYAFFYGFLHFLTYAWLDQFFSIPDIVQDVYKRPFITAGFSAFVVMIPLAITSTKKWIARLGGRRWQWLHRLTYVGAIAGVAHYLWLVKADTEQPLIYGFLLSILLGFRVLQSLRSNHPLPAANCDGDESRQRQVVTRMVEYRNVAVQGIKQPFHGFYRQEKFLGSQARCYLEEKSSLTRSKQ